MLEWRGFCRDRTDIPTTHSLTLCSPPLNTLGHCDVLKIIGQAVYTRLCTFKCWPITAHTPRQLSLLSSFINTQSVNDLQGTDIHQSKNTELMLKMTTRWLTTTNIGVTGILPGSNRYPHYSFIDFRIMYSLFSLPILIFCGPKDFRHSSAKKSKIYSSSLWIWLLGIWRELWRELQIEVERECFKDIFI